MASQILKKGMFFFHKKGYIFVIYSNKKAFIAQAINVIGETLDCVSTINDVSGGINRGVRKYEKKKNGSFNGRLVNDLTFHEIYIP